MPELICAQRTPEWLEARKGKITASVAAACLGMYAKGCSSRRSRQWAWREITGNLTEAERRAQENGQNFAMRWGQSFEPVARNSYEAETGNLVTETGFWVHPTLPWLGASPDGLVGADGLVEVKCPENPYESVPLHYRVQCLTQLAVTGRQWCDFYCWPKPPEKPRLWTVRRAGIPGLIVRLERFYREFVLTNTAPPRRT